MIDFLNESEYQRLLAEETVANQLVENAANKASRSITPVNEGVVSFLKDLFSTSLVYYSFDKKKDGTILTTEVNSSKFKDRNENEKNTLPKKER